VKLVKMTDATCVNCCCLRARNAILFRSGSENWLGCAGL